MKKIIILLLIVALSVSMVACSKPASETTEDSPTIGKDAGSGASDYPSKPIQLIVPVKAGGDTDYNARVLATFLEKYLDNTVVVTNIDGGATVNGMKHVMDAKPDGYQILINGTDQFVPEMLGNTDLTLDSFKTVGIPLLDNSTVLAVHKDSGFTTLPELVEQSKANPNGIEYGMKIGATNQICGVAMDSEWGTAFNKVDVGNNAAKMVALLGRQTDVINIAYSVAADYFKTGEFVPVALLGTQRNPTLSDIPLASDYGFTDLDFGKFFWLGAHPETPDDIINTLSAALKQATEDPEYISKMEERFLTVGYMGPEEAHEYAINLYNETMLPYKDEFIKQQ